MPKKILIVDDDAMSNTLVGFLLKTNSYEVVSAQDGQEGLEKAKQEKPDLIVLDVMMPKMDGYTFLHELKRSSDGKIPPIIMLTAKDQMEVTFKMEGVADYFVKPLDTDKFLKRVKQVLPPTQ